MAPNAGLDVYDAYKAGTTRLTTWLIQSALRCKVEVKTIEDTGSSRSNYRIPLAQFKKLALAIVASSNPKIKAPAHILTLIRHVITLRNHAASFFSRMAGSYRAAAFEKNSAGHRHFIKVLEEVLDILSQSREVPEAMDYNSALSGMFAALQVEEPVSEGAAPTRTPKQALKPAVQYELETTDSDHAFAIFAFFADINEIRDYLKTVWKDYRDGKLDGMTAAVTTDTGFNQIRRSCEALSQTPEFLGFKRSGILKMAQLEGNGDHLVAQVFLAEYLGGELLTDALSEWTCGHVGNKIASFAQVLDPKGVPMLKPDHYGVYDPEQDRSKLSKKQQDQEDLIVTMNILPEFVKLSRAQAHLPVEDELTTGLRIMMDTCDAKQLPMFTYFAFQILLDIHNVLRQHVVRPFDELQATAKRAVSTMDDYFRLSRNKQISTWAPQNDAAFRQIRDLAEQWALTDKCAQLPLQVPRGAPKVQPFYLLKNHPVLSGLLMFNLNMRLQEAGITLCNAWGSVIYPAHLYNACRQSANWETEWRDMDYVIATHSAKRIFVGAPPTERSEYLKRFLLALGGSASNFARNRRPSGRSLIVESKRGPRGLKSTTPVRDTFEARYVHGGEAVLSKGNLVAMLAIALKAERTSPVSMGLQKLYDQTLAQHNLSRLHNLRIVREGVAAEELHLLFDYIGLHFRGYKLLRTLHTDLHAQLAHYFGPNYIENESELPFIIGYIFEVIFGSERIAQELRLEDVESRLLQTALETLKKFLDNSKNGHDSLMMAKALSSTVVYHFHAGTLDSPAPPLG